MSHFLLAVFTDAKPSSTQLHAILAPYEETRTNPYSKWDWWRIGGRWLGQLIVKHGVRDVIIGESGVFKNEANPPEAVDGARIGDLDLPAMLEKRRSELGCHWDEASAFLSKHGKAHPLMPDTRKIRRSDYVIEQARAFIPFAYILNGQWYDSGEMGMIGFVRNKQSNDKWETEFSDTLKEQPSHHWLTVLDCHI